MLFMRAEVYSKPLSKATIIRLPLATYELLGLLVYICHSWLPQPPPPRS